MFVRESLDSERDRMEEAEQRRMSLLGRMMTDSHQSEVSSLSKEIDLLKQQIHTANNEMVHDQLISMKEKLAEREMDVEKMTSHVSELEDQLINEQKLLKEKCEGVDGLLKEVDRLQTSLDSVHVQMRTSLEMKKVFYV